MISTSFKPNPVFSYVTAALFFAVGIYIYIDTGYYTNSIIWILVSPLALSSHPVFYSKPNELNLTETEYKKKRKWLNVIRFMLFALGMALFLVQLLNDITK